MSKYLNKTVVLKEDYGNLKKGSTGLCTADLRKHDKDGDIFAVMFQEYGWISIRGDDTYKKFEIIEN